MKPSPTGVGWRSSATRWGRGTILLHWTVAALVLAMLGLGLVMVHAIADPGRRFELYQTHKSLGFVVLAFCLVRIGWRVVDPRPAGLGQRGLLRHAARATHLALYAVPLALVATGCLAVSASPIPLPTAVFGLVTVPNLTGPDVATYLGARSAHRLLAWSVGGLVLVHTLAGLLHHGVAGDDTLRRMLGLGLRGASKSGKRTGQRAQDLTSRS
ncbi:MAG: cytochrome b [Alsobacter sp.]